MKNVYVFFFATQFKTGTAIRMVTRNKYNHVAFSFTPDTECLYSYARYRYHEPLLSGFGREATDRYAPTRGVEIRVCEVSVTDEQYAQIQEKISHYQEMAAKTRYNFFDLIIYPIPLWRRHVNLQYTHTCLSFLCELLDMQEVHSITTLQEKLSDCIFYEGLLSDFEVKPSQGMIDFYERRSRRSVWKRNGILIASLTLSLLRSWYHVI